MNKKTLFVSLGICLISLTLLFNRHQTLQASTSSCLSETTDSSASKVSSTIAKAPIKTLAASNQAFAFKLYQALVEQNSDDNVFISPSSIVWALAMTYNGASDQTKTEMAEALGLIGMTPQDVKQANLQLKESLEKADPEVTLAIANSLWIKEGFQIKPSFCHDSKVYYDAKVEELDFDNPKSLQTINQWVRTNTHQKIKQIINKLGPSDVLLLMNALYFKGEWQEQFDPSQTREQPFYLANGQTKQHPLMSQQHHYNYYETEEFQAVSLPYGSGRMSLYVFLPRPHTDLSTFHQQLTSENWTQWMQAFRKRDGIVEFPRFKLESEFDLKSILISLGMKRMFDGTEADFSSLTDAQVAVDQVKHKTFVEVNEEGTEAAAVSAVIISESSVSVDSIPFQMKVDRPFFTALRDNETGTLLFLGAIMEPE